MGEASLLTLNAAKGVAAVSVQKHAMWASWKLPRRGTERYSAHRSSVRTSISVWDLIPLPLTCRRRWNRIDFTAAHVCLDWQAKVPKISVELTSTTTTSTFTFGGKFSSGWKCFTMATSRWMVARTSLLWMTDRRLVDNKIKIGERAQMGITGEVPTSLQWQRKGKINEAYKNRMATWQQWVLWKDHGFLLCCDFGFSVSRCSIMPRFDLFRPCRTKNLSLLELLDKDLLLMKHRV